jgi:hypothetical protein
VFPAAGFGVRGFVSQADHPDEKYLGQRVFAHHAHGLPATGRPAGCGQRLPHRRAASVQAFRDPEAQRHDAVQRAGVSAVAMRVARPRM